MPPKAVAGWFVAGTDGQLWGVITIAYFRPEAVHQREEATGRYRLIAAFGGKRVQRLLLSSTDIRRSELFKIDVLPTGEMRMHREVM